MTTRKTLVKALTPRTAATVTGGVQKPGVSGNGWLDETSLRTVGFATLPRSQDSITLVRAAKPVVKDLSPKKNPKGGKKSNL